MKNKYLYIDDLMEEFKNSMLPALAQGSISAYECFTKAHIESTGCRMPITFTLGNLFTAIWIWGAKAGIHLPEQSDYNKDFIEFWQRLTNPWPIEELEAVGLKIKRKTTTGSKVNHTYELSCT